MLKPPEEVALSLLEGLRPDPLLLVSEWADENRVLSSRASSEPGRWRTSRTPYLKGIMDSLSRVDPVQVVVVVAGAQVGKTEAGLCWIGATMDGSPGPMLAVQPTLEIAKRFSRQRVTPLIDETPALKAKVRPARDRDSGNTMLSKEYPGGILMLTGSNSGAGLRSMPVRDLFMDEVDAYPGDVDGEGDPVDLAIARTRTFARRKVLITSTPTVAGCSRVWSLWEESDQRVFEVPCPECGHRQVLEWERMHYSPDAIGDGVRMACEGCGVLIEERHKGRMLAEGEWRALNPGAKTRGFHVNSLYSPLGWFSWADAAVMNEKARGDAERVRVFENTVLGRPWQAQGEAPEWEQLYRRRLPYEIGKVPEGGLLLTAGVDVQRSPGRLEVEIVAWGPRMQSWSVDYRILEGDTGSVDGKPWKELAALLNEPFACENGETLLVTRMAVDSGDQTQTVYAWVREQKDIRVMAVKGRDTQTQLIGMPTMQEVTSQGRKYRHGVKLWNLGVSTAKTELYGWLRQDPPLETGDEMPRGWCHFPQYPEEYFLGLTAEELRVKKIRGFPEYKWEKIRKRNEPLDCRVYARAALASIGADRWKPEQWEARAGQASRKAARSVKAVAPAAPASVPAVAEAAEPAPVKKRRQRGDSWLRSGNRRL